jgi:hypothetical protein
MGLADVNIPNRLHIKIDVEPNIFGDYVDASLRAKLLAANLAAEYTLSTPLISSG